MAKRWRSLPPATRHHSRWRCCSDNPRTLRSPDDEPAGRYRLHQLARERVRGRWGLDMTKAPPKQIEMFSEKEVCSSPREVRPLHRRVWGGYAAKPGSGPEGFCCRQCASFDGDVCLKAVEMRTSGRFSNWPPTRRHQEARLRKAAGKIRASAKACRYFQEPT